MPRIGDTYALPPNTAAVSDTVIESAKYNAVLADLEADANASRPVAAGGTGAATPAGARSALGLAIGTNVQAYDPGLASIAGLTTVADRMIYTTAADTYAVATLTALGREIAALANDAAYVAHAKSKLFNAGTFNAADADKPAVQASVAGVILGVGQTWRQVTRVANTSYENTTGRPIQVAGIVLNSVSPASSLTFEVENVAGSGTWVEIRSVILLSSVRFMWVDHVIPAGAAYRITTPASGSVTINLQELSDA